MQDQTALPAPPVPADLDLRDFPYMPLDVVRLRDSAIAMLEPSAEARWAALMLWCAAWHQVPAGSVPNDDRVLARLAGVDLRHWKRIRDAALRGFALHNDGKLYHSVVVEKALAAAKLKADRRARTEAARRSKAEKASHSTGGGSGTSTVTPDTTAPVTPPVTPPVASPNRMEWNGMERKVGSEGQPAGQAWQAVRVAISDLFLDENLTPPTDLLLTDVWAANGWKPDLTLTAVKAKMGDMRNRKFRPRTLAAFTDAVRAAHEMASKPNTAVAGALPAGSHEDWDRAVALWVRSGKQVWVAPGGRPGFDSCKAPRDILTKHLPEEFPPLN